MSLLITSFFEPVLPYQRELELDENAPGARMLSSVLKLRRRLLVDMLLLNEPTEVELRRLRPSAPGVLEMLLAGLTPGVP